MQTIKTSMDFLNVWQERRDVLHSSRWKYGVGLALILIFFILVEIVIITAPIDPVIPVLAIIAIIILLPVTIFVIDLYFCET